MKKLQKLMHVLSIVDELPSTALDNLQKRVDLRRDAMDVEDEAGECNKLFVSGMLVSEMSSEELDEVEARIAICREILKEHK